MKKNSPFIRGTLLLTGAGVLTRIIGFFYRIFLSRTIGEEGMGIYQLTAPVMALSYCLTCSGIQTAISKHVASYQAKKQARKSLGILYAGFFISFFLSIFLAAFLYLDSGRICERFLMEPRCTPLVRLFALSIPFASLHCCINGYYFGLKKTAIPSFSQLLEQIVRVGSVFLLYRIGLQTGQQISFVTSMFGILTGEVASSLFSFFALFFTEQAIQNDGLKKDTPHRQKRVFFPYARHSGEYSKKIAAIAIPLTANRLVLSFLQSIEAVQIPAQLVRSGMTKTMALKSYGVLTGMALPMILFPTALTSSVSILLLPYISEAQTQKNAGKIKNAIQKGTIFCFLLGSLCCIFFLLTGKLLGTYLFNSKLAGTYICYLCIICPIFYLGSVLMSVLHGLGKATASFFINTSSLSVRLFFVFFFIPRIGMAGYILGIFFSQLLLTALLFGHLRKYMKQCNCTKA